MVSLNRMFFELIIHEITKRKDPVLAIYTTRLILATAFACGISYYPRLQQTDRKTDQLDKQLIKSEPDQSVEVRNKVCDVCMYMCVYYSKNKYSRDFMEPGFLLLYMKGSQQTPVSGIRTGDQSINVLILFLPQFKWF